MKIAEIGAFKCNLPECSIQTTGKCVNALDIEECPNKIGQINLIIEPDNGAEPSSEEEVNQASKVESTMRLAWGKKYEEGNLVDLTYRYPCTLILLIGEPSCGKSTLYAALFDSFQKGQCGEYLFAGSRTPIAFEEICHLAREKSKGRIPDTERTKSYEFIYYHLAARMSDLKNATKHLLFADVNGEKYQAAKLSDEEMLKLNIVRKADHIFFIADGALLCSNSKKHVVKNDVWTMLTRCFQNNMISENQRVNLIITKWDKVHSENKIKEIEEFFIAPTFLKFPDLIGSVLKIASRSLNNEIAPRTGIDKFLSICMSNLKYKFNSNQSFEIEREFQKFKYD